MRYYHEGLEIVLVSSALLVLAVVVTVDLRRANRKMQRIQRELDAALREVDSAQ